MATLHKEFNDFNKKIRLTDSRRDSLVSSRNGIRKKIKDWFYDNKKNETMPKFHSQGSFSMNTTINPIPIYDEDNNKLVKYDIDDGVYFIEESDNRKNIDTYHNWIYEAVKDHTNQEPKRKTTCVRVIFSDGHHIDLPIYYKTTDTPELAHRSQDWIESDPKEFYEWFNNKAKKNKKIRKIVRYLKAWKNYREVKNTNLKLPSGFELTILVVNNFVDKDNDDTAFYETVKSIKNTLQNTFECLRPTTPKNENLFEEYSETRKNNFLDNLDSLLKACENAADESNFKEASKYYRSVFGDRFPYGKDEEQESKAQSIYNSFSKSDNKPKPYGEKWI